MKWISVKNEIPEEMQEVIIFDELIGVFIGYYYTSNKSFICGVDGTRLKNVSHWMQLPKLPVTLESEKTELSNFTFSI